jgi:hypothetical protein
MDDEWRVGMEPDTKKIARSKSIYGIYLGNVMKALTANERWTMESFGVEKQVELLDSVITECKNRKERIKKIWKLEGIKQ